VSAARRRTPGTRRAELIDAARSLFATRGVANTTVSDIVREAGAAQGTFYLYFETKNALVNAIVEQSTDEVIAGIEAAIADAKMTSLEKVSAIAAAFVAMADEPHEVELLALFHRPENVAFHDHIARHTVTRVAPLLAQVIEQGRAEGVFTTELDPLVSASLILGSLQYSDAGSPGMQDVEGLVRSLTTFALYGLGYTPDKPA